VDNEIDHPPEKQMDFGGQDTPGEYPRILLVDDDEAQLLLGRLLLERLGYTVITSTDGSDAEKIFALSPYKFLCVATDLTMLPVDGLDLSRRLLKINPALLIILLTGYDHPAVLREAQEIGIREVCPKPVTVDEFADVLQRIGL
jgi:two-component system cell cycle sensor histidine kinase/response regulator CckA